MTLRNPVKEQQAIRTALDQTQGHRRAAAQLLGISKTTLHKRMDLYSLRNYKPALCAPVSAPEATWVCDPTAGKKERAKLPGDYEADRQWAQRLWIRYGVKFGYCTAPRS